MLSLATLKRQAEQEADIKTIAKDVAKDTETTFIVPLSKRMLRGANDGGLEALTKARVLRLEAHVTCTKEAVRSVEFRVVRSDAMGGLLRRAEKGAQGFKIEAKGADAEEILKQLNPDGEQEGATTLYTLTVSNAEPSARLREFADAMRKELQR